MTEFHSADTAELSVVDDLLAKHFGPSPPPVCVQFGALSHPGRVRPNNEDHYLVIEQRRTRSVLLTNLPEEVLRPADNTGYVLAVADGMGGGVRRACQHAGVAQRLGVVARCHQMDMDHQ